jgi:hypothetical protein
MKKHLKRFTITHTVCYLVVGIIAMLLMSYKETFMTDPYFSHFRPLDSPIVQSAVLFQIIRGGLIAIVLYPFKEIIVQNKRGWIYLFGLLFGLSAVLSLPAAPGTIEGIIYTDVSITAHLLGYPEILIQLLLISTLYWYWYKDERSQNYTEIKNSNPN